MLDNLILILLGVSFIFIAPGRFDWDQIFCSTAMMSVVLLAGLQKPRRSVSLVGITLFFFLALFGMCLQFEYFKFLGIIDLFIGCLFIKTIAEHSRISKVTLGHFLTSFTIFTLLYLGVQLLNWDPIYRATFQDIGGSFGKPWALGCYAVLAMPFLWRVRPIWTLLLLPLLWASHSTLCIGAAIVVAFYLCPKHWRLLGGLALLAGGIGYACFGRDPIDVHRFQVWARVWPYVTQSFWFGYGFDSFLHSAFAHQTNTELHHWVWLHNEYYQVLFELGFIGLLLSGFWLLSRWVRTVSPTYKAAILGLGILSFFHPVFHWGRLLFFIGLIIAFSYREATYGT